MRTRVVAATAYVTLGNLPLALQLLRDSLAIAQRLAAQDPANAEWQGDLVS